jgi:hypothetical protein
MFDVRRVVRHTVAALAVALTAGLSTPSKAETGTLRVEIVKGGFIVGVGGGNGVLAFKGRRYPFSVSGLSFGATIGASKTDLVGRAYNLRQPSDLAGTYSAVGGGVAVAGGGGGARLQNANGVVIELQGRKVGLEFSVGVSGATITMR